MPLNKKTHSGEEIEFLNSIGPRMAAARVNAKLSQQKVADVLGCSLNHVSDIETANAAFTLFEFKKMCELYKVDAGDLINGGVGYGFINDAVSMNLGQREAIGSILHDINLLMEETVKNK